MKNVNSLQTALKLKDTSKEQITSKLLRGIQVLANAKKIIVLNEEIDMLEEFISDLPAKSYLKARKDRKLKHILDTDGREEELMLQYKAEVNLINWILG